MLSTQFVSPHCHVKSLDSASTPKKFAEREVELGTGYLTVTDHGSLEATRTVYDMCAPGGAWNGKLKPILGVEGYFRDDSDPLIKAKLSGDATVSDVYKYCHITLHAQDEAAYKALIKASSDADLRAEYHGRERKPLYDWATLETLGGYNITGTSGCLIGMVGRHLLQNDDPETAIAFYERTRACFKPGNFYVEIFPHETKRKFQSRIDVTCADGSVLSFAAYRRLKTATGDTISAQDLANDFSRSDKSARDRHVAIMDVMESRKWTGRSSAPIVSVQQVSGFVENECRPWCDHSDYQHEVNRFLFSLAKRYGDKILISDDAHFAYPDEKIVQDTLLDNWRFAESHHRMSTGEAVEYFRNHYDCDDATIEGWVQNSREWASGFDGFSLGKRNALPNKWYPSDTLAYLLERIQVQRRMDWGNPAMQARLKSEISLLTKNGIDFLPYFFVGDEVCDLYLRSGQLTGPGRGSAAGLLLPYLLGVTHVNPLDFDLSQDRFMTADRAASGKLPDIDQDLPHRDLLVDPENPEKGWLKERFGDCVAQMSTDIALKLKNAIKDVHRLLDGFVSSEIEDITKKLPAPPQGVDTRDFVFGYDVDGTYTPGLVETSEILKDYIQRFPKHWDLVTKILGLPRDHGRHPCGWVISSDPIDSFIPMTTIGGVRVTAFTASSVEAAGGLKMDYLVVNAIKDIMDAIRLIQKRHAPDLLQPLTTIPIDQVKFVRADTGLEIPALRAIPLPDGRYADVWKLPEDVGVYIDIARGKVESVFQLSGGAARAGLRNFPEIEPGVPTLRSIEGLSAFTALDRPGPLDAYVEDGAGNKHNMLVEYARRARGEEGVGRLPILDEMLPETYGIIVYQEQLQRIFQVVGGTTGIQANDFRQRIGKKKITEVLKKDRPLFMAGAVPKLGEKAAETLWSQMQTFGQYGFNKSHAVCYMHIAYACAWLKHHYPLEWWCAVLNNAKQEDVNGKHWGHVHRLLLPPDITRSSNQFTIEGDKIRLPLWVIQGIGEAALTHLAKVVPGCKTIEEFVAKEEAWKFDNGVTEVKAKPTKTNPGRLVEVRKKAKSPLSQPLMRKLALSGALDTLFEGTEGDVAKLTRLDFASMTQGVKVKPHPFGALSDAERYQVVKEVMPAFGGDLLSIVRSSHPALFVDGRVGVVYYNSGGKSYAVLPGEIFAEVQENGLDVGEELTIALVGFVLEDKIFAYQNGAKKAWKMVLDVGGFRPEIVKWPRKGILPEFVKRKHTGSIVVAKLSRRKYGEDFFFDDIDVLHHPFAFKNEESSSESPSEAP